MKKIILIKIMLIAALILIPISFIQKAKADDYTTFTEVDPASQITVVNASYIYATCDSSHNAFVYKDYGVDGLNGTFEYQVEMKWNSFTNKNAGLAFWCVSEYYDNFYNLMFQKTETGYGENRKTIGLMCWSDNEDPYSYVVLASNNGTGFTEETYAISVEMWYYFTIGRNNTDVYAKIYSDKARTALLTTLTTPYVNDSYRYLYALNSWNRSMAFNGSWDIRNLNGSFEGWTPPSYPPWDINQDGVVNYLDLSLLVSHYGQTGGLGWIPEDINDDGAVNYLDLSLLVSHYGESYL